MDCPFVNRYKRPKSPILEDKGNKVGDDKSNTEQSSYSVRKMNEEDEAVMYTKKKNVKS